MFSVITPAVTAHHNKSAAYFRLINSMIFSMNAAFSLTLGIIVGASYICQAQNISSQPIQVTVPTSTPYAITVQDANSRVWQRTDYQRAPSGDVITNTHSFTEICSGLNHLVNGQWVESKEEIDILANGTAVATNGQHQAYFPGNIYQGQIELVTPGGQHLQSRPLALSYFDGTNTVVIAELTNSTGIVVGNNQVVYPNAFTDLKADVRYTFTKAGFEQDIVLRQQPPTPESLGLNPDTARLQIMTEFFSAPQPTIASTALPTQAGVSLDDESLNFGTMQMVPGRAFLMGQSAKNAGAMVSKHWLLVNGRQILIEEVPVDAILEGLAALPLTAMNSGSSKHSHTTSKYLKLPPQRLAQNDSKAMLIARTDPPAQGFILDYQSINTSQTNFTFRGDTTYYLSGAVNLSGTNTFEGGTVIKYASGASLTLQASHTAINWAASAYLPVILTAKDDNTVGESISGSTGTPTNYYANPALALSGNAPDISYFRIAYAQLAISATGTTNSIKNGQIIDCQNGIYAQVTGTVNLENLLFDHVQIDLYNLTYDNNIYVQNSTFNSSSNLTSATGSFQTVMPYFTNCIFVNISQLTNNPGGTGLIYGVAGAYNGFNNSPFFGNSSSQANPYLFQAVGGGSFYLATNSNFHNIGTVNIDPTLLASFKQKTTYPPILYSNITVSINTTLSPQAQRDTDTPDLGYHYDPIDYLVDQYTITNASLTLTNGVTIASYNDSGVILSDGSGVVSIGSPLYPNWFVRYSSVQEQPVALGSSGLSAAESFNSYHLTAAAPGGQFRFSKFACPAGGGNHLYDGQPGSPSFIYSNLLVQDCEFWGGNNIFSGGTNTVITLKNNLFARSIVLAGPTSTYTNNSLALSNNLFCNTSVTLLPSVNSNSNLWFVYNNSLDTCIITTAAHGNQQFTLNGYNAYIQCNQQLSPTNVNNKVLTNAFAYQTGPLGTFYQPTTSQLIDEGSTNANLVGLYHYTVTTNLIGGGEVKEANSTVDIGYHYVATDQYGNPLDINGGGIPDYLEDTNGDGLPDSWEMTYFETPNLPMTLLEGQSFNTLLYDYQNGIDPTVINFALSVTNEYVNILNVPVQLNIMSGVPSFVAVVVDDTNYAADASWTAYTTYNLNVNLGSTPGWHDVWIGLRALPSDAIQSWQWKRLNFTLPPVLAITNPVTGIVDQPMIQIHGYSQEPLASISYDISNAVGFIANQSSEITDQYYDTNALGFTTNYFECLDVPLAIGSNTIVIHVIDLAGNTTTTNFNFTLDYSSKTNPPVVQITWPTNGTQISGSAFTCRGWIGDPTATVSAQLVFPTGNTNIYSGEVERNGNFWLENVPIIAGTNTFAITITDAVGNRNMTNVNVVHSSLALTINPVSDTSQLWHATVNLTGTISDATYAIWVNGLKGHNNGDGTWSANNVPVNGGGTGSFTATAYGPTEQQPDGSYGN
jgi:archaellum component FlaF (FlaF/FlaG flagellin family)